MDYFSREGFAISTGWYRRNMSGMNTKAVVAYIHDTYKPMVDKAKWSLFGGCRRPDEAPGDAISREIFEELVIRPARFEFLWSDEEYGEFEKAHIRLWFFHADVEKVWPEHQLREGRAAEVFSFEQLLTLDIPGIIFRTIERFHKLKGIR